MVIKEDVVDAAIGLTLQRGAVPSIAEVARAVGLTKQGVLHYFPSRAVLDDAVLLRALNRLDDEMGAAALKGGAAEAYLRLAAPSEEDRAAALVMVTMLRRGSATALPPAVSEAFERWESLIAEQVGDPVRAKVVRLVGDGLFSESLVSGVPPSTDLLDDLVAHLVTDDPRSRP